MPIYKATCRQHHESITHEITYKLRNTKILSLENYLLYGTLVCEACSKDEIRVLTNDQCIPRW